MASLTAHLLEPGDHGRLGFRADCPVCRQRLLGSTSSEPVVSQRARVVLAGGVLALTAVAPPVSVASQSPSMGTKSPPAGSESASVDNPQASAASEPDQTREGLAAPDSTEPGTQSPTTPAPAPGTENPDFDPGGGGTALPFEVQPPTPAPEDDNDSAEQSPLESEPVDDPEGRRAPLSDPEPQPVAPDSEADAPAPPLEAAPPPAPSAPPAPPPAPEVPEPTAPPPPSEPKASAPGHDRGGAPRGHDRAASEKRPQQPDAPRAYAPPASEEPRSGRADGPTVPASPAATGAPLTPPAQAVTAAAAHTGAKFHVVRPGESLWAIARQLLGPSASPAHIAQEVSRLWELNRDRIGTGDPDLLEVGTKLRLR